MTQFTGSSTMTELNQQLSLQRRQTIAIICACQFGHFQKLKDLVRATPTFRDYTHLFSVAIEHNHLEIARWCYQTLCPTLNFSQNEFALPRRAVELGHLEICRWFFDESGQSIDITARNYRSVILAARAGQLETLQWLRQTGRLEPIHEAAAEQLLDAAAEDGQLDVVRWLCEATSLPFSREHLKACQARVAVHQPVVDYLQTVNTILEALTLTEYRRHRRHLTTTTQSLL